MANPGLKIAQQHAGPVCVVALTGRVDNATAGELQAELKTLLNAGEKAILLDLAGVTYLTSAAFRVLLVAHKQAHGAAARFALCNVTGHVRDLFDLGELTQSFTILGARDEAVAKLS
ncbi:MAG TPA: STAS domain-containing protein [Xanthobacteraceae bacterium]|jgi:anti-anti-sigma factor